MTVLLEIDTGAAAGRGAEDDRFEREGDALQRAVAEAYGALADAEPERFVRVDAARDPEAVHADVLAAVRERRRMTLVLAGTEDHPHARVSLVTALETGPSHAYLFHGPAGVGKREAARAFAAELLAQGSPEPDGVRHRVHSGTHPDLTWVRPTGAHVMRRSDVAQAVVDAAGRTPFEASRRVFVLERVDALNDEAANSLLKTLEEPASFVHLVLLTDSLGQVMDTVVSRCQLVRFDPLPPARIAQALEADGVEASRALACARLALGNGERARLLASDEGGVLLDDAEAMVRAALGVGMRATRRPGLLAPGEGRQRPGRGRGRGRRARRAWTASRRGASAPRSSASSTRRSSARPAGRTPRCSTCA